VAITYILLQSDLIRDSNANVKLILLYHMLMIGIKLLFTYLAFML